MTDEQKRIVDELQEPDQFCIDCEKYGEPYGCSMCGCRAWEIANDAATMIEYQASEIDTLKAKNERIRQNSVSHETVQALMDSLINER